MPTGSSGLALKPIKRRRTKAFRSAIDLRRLALLNRGSPCGKLSLKKTYIALNAVMKSRQALSVSHRCRCRCRRVLAVANTTTSASSARLAQRPKLAPGSECKIATLNHSITGTPTRKRRRVRSVAVNVASTSARAHGRLLRKSMHGPNPHRVTRQRIKRNERVAPSPEQ